MKISRQLETDGATTMVIRSRCGKHDGETGRRLDELAAQREHLRGIRYYRSLDPAGEEE